jgi:hypothetical protein
LLLLLLFEALILSAVPLVGAFRRLFVVFVLPLFAAVFAVGVISINGIRTLEGR